MPRYPIREETRATCAFWLNASTLVASAALVVHAAYERLRPHQEASPFSSAHPANAIALLVLGLGLMALHYKRGKLAEVAGGLVTAWWLGTLIGSLLGLILYGASHPNPFSIGQPLFALNQPTPCASVAFLLAGAAVALRSREYSRKAAVFSHLANAGVLALAVFSLAAYLLQLDQSLGSSHHPRAGLYASLCLLAVGLVLLLRPSPQVPAKARERFIVPGSILISGGCLSALVFLSLVSLENELEEHIARESSVYFANQFRTTLLQQARADRRAAARWQYWADESPEVARADLKNYLSDFDGYKSILIRDNERETTILEPQNADPAPFQSLLDAAELPFSPIALLNSDSELIAVTPLAGDQTSGFLAAIYDLQVISNAIASPKFSYTLSSNGRMLAASADPADLRGSQTVSFEALGVSFEATAFDSLAVAQSWKSKFFILLLCLLLSALALLFYGAALRARRIASEKNLLAQRLAERERRYERAISGSLAGIYDWDLTNDTLYWSPQLKELIGLDESFQPSISDLKDRIHPEDLARVKQVLHEHLSSRTDYDCEFRVRDRDDRYLWINSRGQATWNSRGEPVRMAGSVTDIHLRKTAEIALKERESLFRDMIESLDVGVLLVDRDGGIHSCNSSAIRLFGYDQHELLQKKVAELIPFPASSRDPDPESGFRTPLAPQTSRRAGAQAIRQDGSTFPVEIGLRPFTDQSKSMLLVVVTDMTERERAKRDLQASEERFQLAIEGASVGIWDWPNVNEDEQWWSPRFYRLLGYECGEIEAGKENFFELLHPEDTEKTRDAVKSCFEGKDAFSVDYRLRLKDGNYRWFMATATLQRDASGSPKRMTGSIQDIHERRKAEEIRAYAVALEQSNRDLGEFTYAASHDLQEPLRTITNFLGLLEDRYAAELPDEAKSFIAFTTDAAERMRNLITGLLSLSRVDSNSVPAEEVDLNNTLDETKDNLRILIDERSVVIRNGSLPSIIGHSHLLAQLFQNIIGNAIKYCSKSHPPEIEIDWVDEGESVLLSFADNGIGIDPRSREAIFGVFKRLHSQSAYTGSGIGLALCRRIAERHLGKIWVEANAKGGSTFYVRLDKGAPAKVATASSRASV